MARRCQLTGKGPLSGHRISHANNKTKRRQLPNVQWKRLYVAELHDFIRVRLSTRALRTVQKVGLLRFLEQQGLRLQDFR